jgi:biotin synthase
MNRDEIIFWLTEQDPACLEHLWRMADTVRRENVGEQIHLRGLIEFSNVCARNCHYCGMRAGRRSLVRYRMAAAEILACAGEAVSRGYGTVVLQSGENPGLAAAWLADVIRQIKRDTGLAITLSCGERSRDELALWREAGADRYLLRFETSSMRLWNRIHPSVSSQTEHRRLAILHTIRELGYETGSGIMVGIPGQTWESLVQDIEWFRSLDLDMMGIGPYIPHPDTPLGRRRPSLLSGGQVPATELMTHKVLALARLVCPRTNIPSTTALATLNRDHGWELGLRRGANVLMVNLTPQNYRGLYDIYPAKAEAGESCDEQRHRVRALIEGLGRLAGAGPGASRNYQVRRGTPAADGR